MVCAGVQTELKALIILGTHPDPDHPAVTRFYQEHPAGVQLTQADHLHVQARQGKAQDQKDEGDHQRHAGTHTV